MPSTFLGLPKRSVAGEAPEHESNAHAENLQPLNRAFCVFSECASQPSTGLARASAVDDFLALWLVCVADESDGEVFFNFPLRGVRALARSA